MILQLEQDDCGVWLKETLTANALNPQKLTQLTPTPSHSQTKEITDKITDKIR
jgi:hypothetical protein